MKSLLIALSILTLTVPNVSFADRESAQLVSEAKITLVRAVQAAEEAIPGTAFEAELDDDSWKPTYIVSIAQNGRVFKVHIDAVDGKFLGSREDLD